MTDQISDTEDSIGLEVTVCSNGVINVRREQSDRGHSVFVDGHSVVKCSCKGFKFHGHCCHQKAIQARPIVLSSAEALSETQALTDGGVATETEIDESDSSDSPTRSENVCFDCGSSYPQGETCDCSTGIEKL